LKIDTADLLHIITSTADELSRGTNIDDLAFKVIDVGTKNLEPQKYAF